MTNDVKTPMATFEESVTTLLRKSRRTFAQMAESGQRGLALIDMLEAQMPLASIRCRELMMDAVERIIGPLPRG